jgi:hypothetical protein
MQKKSQEPLIPSLQQNKCNTHTQYKYSEQNRESEREDERVKEMSQAWHKCYLLKEL